MVAVDGNEVSRASGSTKNEARNAVVKAILFNPNLGEYYITS